MGLTAADGSRGTDAVPLVLNPLLKKVMKCLTLIQRQ
jgi:hypothetical protein